MFVRKSRQVPVTVSPTETFDLSITLFSGTPFYSPMYKKFHTLQRENERVPAGMSHIRNIDKSNKTFKDAVVPFFQTNVQCLRKNSNF